MGKNLYYFYAGLTILNILGSNHLSFAGKLENILLSPTDNSIISPLSICSTLVPLQIGADGKTKHELTEFLRNEFKAFKNIDNNGEVNSGSTQVLQIQGPQVNSITALFTSLPLQPKYLKATQSSSSRTKVHLYENFNFTRNYENINELVRTSTNGLIDNIIDAGSVSEETKLIVVNAVHFKAKWRQPFEPITALQPFYHGSKTDVTDVPMMTQQSTNYYAEVPEIEAKIVEIPYENGEYAMRVILPDQMNGLPKVLELLKNYDLDNDLRMKLTEVDIILPQFRISNELELDRTLKYNGLTTLFSPGANLSNLVIQGRNSNEGNLFVDRLISKTVLDVSPIGTEGGSATAAFIIPLSGLQTFDEFIADHPFAFQILSTKEKTLLFSGTFVKPPKTKIPIKPTSITSTSSEIIGTRTNQQPTNKKNKNNNFIHPQVPQLNIPLHDFDIRSDVENDTDDTQLTFYLNKKIVPTKSTKNNDTETTTPWWVHRGKPEYLQPSHTTSPTTTYKVKPSSLGLKNNGGLSDSDQPRFQQPEPKHPTAIRFPFPLTDPTTMFVLGTHAKNTSTTNTI